MFATACMCMISLGSLCLPLRASTFQVCKNKVWWPNLAGMRVHPPYALHAACQVVCETGALPGGAVALPGAAGGALTDIAFAPGGHLLAAGGRDGQARACA